MARKMKFTDPTDIAIIEIHRRFTQVMEEVRLESIASDMKQSYLSIMTALTEKLAIPSKPLHEVVGEVMAEAGPMLFAAMQNR
jgi:hypothetical protein